jgi:opacity protein-like surface antigen
MVRRSAAVLLALALPALAAAQYDPRYPPPRYYGPPPVGPTFSAWVGYAAPTGQFDGYGGDGLGSVLNGAIPFGAEFGYRFSPLFRGGIYFEGAPVFVDSSACYPGDPCGGSNFQLGVEAQVHFAPYHRVDPWVGLGVGYEWLNVDATGGTGAGYPEHWRYTGWIFPRLSGGLDFAVSPFMTLGPYVAYSAGEYGDVYTASTGTTASIGQRAYHGWFSLGVRGNFNW